MSYRYILSGTSFNDVNSNASGFNFYRVYPSKMVNGERVVGRSEKYVYVKPYPVAPVANLKAFGEVNRVRLNWSLVPGSDGYIIYRRYPGEGDMSYLSETTTTSFIDANARRNAQNSYRVYAYQIINGEKVLGRSNGYVFAAALEPPLYVPTSGDKRALETVQSYLKLMSFSREGLIRQLEYERFTHDQAVYAVNQVY